LKPTHLDDAIRQPRHEAITAVEYPAGAALTAVQKRSAPHVIVVGTGPLLDPPAVTVTPAKARLTR
jgi:hypothetical protein